MATSGKAGEKRHPPVHLNIKTDKELKQFMRAILPEFLRVVDPRQSGILDVLYANDVITESDNSSLSGKDVMTRKDQARKLFILLNKVPVSIFLKSVAPELCAKFPHIIPERFRATPESEESDVDNTADCEAVHCLRHCIEHRIRPATMADMLYHEDFLDLEEYTFIIDGARKKEDVWVTLFEQFFGHAQAELRKLEDVVRQLLVRYYMHVPENLGELVSNGMPCTCSHVEAPPQQLPLNFIGKVESWLITERERSPSEELSTLREQLRSPSEERSRLREELARFYSTYSSNSSEADAYDTLSGSRYESGSVSSDITWGSIVACSSFTVASTTPKGVSADSCESSDIDMGQLSRENSYRRSRKLQKHERKKSL